MKLLLDTHLLLWAAGEPRRLSRRVRGLIDNPGNELFFSPASLWEVVIKRGLVRRCRANLLRLGCSFVRLVFPSDQAHFATTLSMCSPRYEGRISPVVGRMLLFIAVKRELPTGCRARINQRRYFIAPDGEQLSDMCWISVTLKCRSATP